MTAEDIFDGNIIEVDCVLFETLVPNRVVAIPNKDGIKKSVQFGIRITNNSSYPYRFILFYLLP